VHPHVSAILEIIIRPVRDPIKYFKNQFDIEIKPLNNTSGVLYTMHLIKLPLSMENWDTSSEGISKKMI